MLNVVVGLVICLVTTVLCKLILELRGRLPLNLRTPVPLRLEIEIPTTVIRTTVFI